MRRIATLLLIIANAASCATSLPNSQPFPVWEKNAKEDYCGISVLSSVWRKQVFLNWPRLWAARPRKRYPSILRVRERLRNQLFSRSEQFRPCNHSSCGPMRSVPRRGRAVKKLKPLGDYHSTYGNSQVGKGGLPPLDTLRLSVTKTSGGKPPFPTCEIPYLDSHPSTCPFTPLNS